MEAILLEALSILGLILLGWCLAEIFKSFSGRSENITQNNPKYFSLVGIVITQKDVQRLLLAIFLGVTLFAILSNFSIINDFEIHGFKLNGEIIKRALYAFIGFAPGAVMAFIKKKVTEKTGMKNNDLIQSIGGELPPTDDE